MTDLFGRFILTIAFVMMLLAGVRAAFGEVSAITPEQAIERAVERRLGGDVDVEVTALDTAVAPDRRLEALPEPGGRAGEPMRFVMMAGRARRGIAVATVTVVATYARAARAIARNEAVQPEDVEVVEGELPSIAFLRLPAGRDVVGLTARRNIAAGEPLTEAVLVVPPLIRSGDTVVLTVIAGSVQVTTKARASASGHAGDVIRVVPDGGRALKARITGPGSVEVRQ